MSCTVSPPVRLKSAGQQVLEPDGTPQVVPSPRKVACGWNEHSCMLREMHAPDEKQQAPTCGPHGSGEQDVPPPRYTPMLLRQSPSVRMSQIPLFDPQQAPMHGLGAQVVPSPRKVACGWNEHS